MEGRERFEEVFSTHHAAVLRYATRRVDTADAIDVAAEVFVVAWRRIDEVPREPLPWLYAVARRICANQRRSVERRRRLVERVAATVPDGTGSTVAGPDAGASDSVLARAFDRLGDDDREVLALVAWEGLTAREAGIVLGCSVAATTMRLHRARRRLRELMEGERP